MEYRINIDANTHLWVESFGEQGRPAILLIMGESNQGIFWSESFCQRLSEAGFFVLRFDHRDTGQSSCGELSLTPYDLERLAHDALAILDYFQIEHATLLGLSMGGYLAQILAVRYPDRVQRLILLSSSADHRPYFAGMWGKANPSPLPMPETRFIHEMRMMALRPALSLDQIVSNLVFAWAWLYAGERAFPEHEIEQTVRASLVRALDQRTSLNHMFALSLAPDRLALVKKIKRPTLVIHGRFNPMLPLAHGEYLAREISDARFEVLDMGHAFMFSWEAEILSLVLDFLGEKVEKAPKKSRTRKKVVE